MHTVMRHQCLHCLSAAFCRPISKFLSLTASVGLSISVSLCLCLICLSVCVSLSLSLWYVCHRQCNRKLSYRAGFAIISLSIYSCTSRSLLVHVSVHSASLCRRYECHESTTIWHCHFCPAVGVSDVMNKAAMCHYGASVCNRMRPRALVQNQHARELISTQKTSHKHSNKDLSHLW